MMEQEYEKKYHALQIAWGQWVRSRREERRLTRRQVAAAAFIDPSYITLMERDGCIPSRSKVLAVARALHQDPDEALVRAGFIPMGISVSRILAYIKSYNKEGRE